jgi:predicted DNA-binding transcriptional regulator YafY
MKNQLRRAMMDADTFVVELTYRDSKGQRTRRVVSPIRFVGDDRMLALCLCREEPRQFYLSRCEDVRLIPAAEVIMPVPMRPLEPVAVSPAATVAGTAINPLPAEVCPVV